MANNERGRIVLIFAAVAVAAGGGGFYFIKVYKPKAALTAARADVAAWDVRYGAARACLLGPTPASSVTSEALAVREMSPDPWDRGKCTPLVSRLARDAANSGIDGVEKAWDALDAAAGSAAQAFATHVAASTTLTKDPLADALDALDAARGKLFAAVELPEQPPQGHPLPRAQQLPLQIDGAALQQVSTAPLPPSAHGVVTFGDAVGGGVQLTLVAGGTPHVDRVASGAIRSPNDPTWGAVADDKGVRVGTFDATGQLVEQASLPLPRAALAAVGGAHDKGLVVFGNEDKLIVADVQGGSVHAQPPIAIEVAGAALDANGDIAMLWAGKDKVPHARTWRAGAMQDAAVPADARAPLCLTRDGVAASGDSELLGCTAEVSITSDGDRRMAICSPTCRDVMLPEGAPDNAVVAAASGKLVALAVYAGVLGVWREDGSHTFYGLGGHVRLVSPGAQPGIAMSDGASIDALALADHAYVVIRIPAKGS